MRTLYLYVLDTLADWETGYLLAELRSGRYLKDPSLRYDVRLCGSSMDAITTMGGVHLSPDLLIDDIRPSAGDLLVLPGADTWLEPAQQPAFATVERLLGEGMTVAAICGATLGLACAGLLDHRPHTSNDLAVLKMFCPAYQGEEHYVDEPAVTDDNLITASGLAPVAFAYQVFQRLDVMNPATLEAWYNLYTTRKPEFFFALMQSLPRSGAD
ncbi:type 1 glutamine amidotransferase family protein [Methanosphaerula subterraneus]|uniref:type 1 glutamine amidotransferase family protein n=1 Tax=Methanosphaerula subterraneus TaxID=3350244 RepID=UPI003F850DD1